MLYTNLTLQFLNKNFEVFTLLDYFNNICTMYWWTFNGNFLILHSLKIVKYIYNAIKCQFLVFVKRFVYIIIDNT
jgi:hypothetical protein